MSRSLPLSLSSALGERGCLKIARAALNTSAPCLLQVRSYYPAEERLLARESLDHGCYSRVLGSMVAQCSAELPRALDGGIKEVERPRTQPSHTP